MTLSSGLGILHDDRPQRRPVPRRLDTLATVVVNVEPRRPGLRERLICCNLIATVVLIAFGVIAWFIVVTS